MVKEESLAVPFLLYNGFEVKTFHFQAAAVHTRNTQVVHPSLLGSCDVLQQWTVLHVAWKKRGFEK